MEYRVLGKTGLKVSAVGVGCWQMGGVTGGRGWTGTTDEESIATVHRAEDLGVNLLDTAPTYGDGHSEEVLGKALKGRRDRFVLATKARPITDDPDEEKARRNILELCEGSLRRLQTDHIDVYQLHAVPHEATMGAVMETLAELKKQGKIRWFGISTNDVDAIRKLLGLGEISVVQVGYNLLSRSGEEALRLAKAENLGSLIRVPL
ncbi:MAG: aldo/keto reductase, partial [bacterium]|nr:aldo/keto reductase [bacterium]